MFEYVYVQFAFVRDKLCCDTHDVVYSIVNFCQVYSDESSNKYVSNLLLYETITKEMFNIIHTALSKCTDIYFCAAIFFLNSKHDI